MHECTSDMVEVRCQSHSLFHKRRGRGGGETAQIFCSCLIYVGKYLHPHVFHPFHFSTAWKIQLKRFYNINTLQRGEQADNTNDNSCAMLSAIYIYMNHRLKKKKRVLLASTKWRTHSWFVCWVTAHCPTFHCLCCQTRSSLSITAHKVYVLTRAQTQAPALFWYNTFIINLCS